MSHTSLVLQGWGDEWPEYIMVSHDGMREPGRRYVPERTCRNLDVRMDRGFECSECGYEAETYGDSLCNPDDFEFCPHCGAKVVK